VTAIVKPNETLLIPAGLIHRTIAKQRAVILCFEDKDADTVIVE